MSSVKLRKLLTNNIIEFIQYQLLIILYKY